MNKIFALLLASTLTASAYANQRILCRSVDVNTGERDTIEFFLKTDRNQRLLAAASKVKIDGFGQDTDSTLFEDARIFALRESQKFSRTYHTLDLINAWDLPVDLHVQFKSKVLGRNFSEMPALFVIVDETNNAGGNSILDYALLCSSTVTE